MKLDRIAKFLHKLDLSTHSKKEQQEYLAVISELKKIRELEPVYEREEKRIVDLRQRQKEEVAQVGAILGVGIDPWLPMPLYYDRMCYHGEYARDHTEAREKNMGVYTLSSCGYGKSQRTERLFGNRNIGIAQFCNLYCPGQLGYGEEETVIDRLWLLWRGVGDLKDQEIRVRLVIGDTACDSMAVGLNIVFPEIKVPPRQSVFVTLECYGKQMPVGDLLVGISGPPPYGPHPPTPPILKKLIGL